MVRVLIVEDESQVLALAQSILEQAGHDMTSAATGSKAQSVLNTDEKFDLVFTDVQLANHACGGCGRLAKGPKLRQEIAEDAEHRC